MLDVPKFLSRTHHDIALPVGAGKVAIAEPEQAFLVLPYMNFQPTRAAGLSRLSEFLPRAGRAYSDGRNYDDGVAADGARTNVSQLSPWIKAGFLGEGEVIGAALATHGFDQSEKFIAEVFWRVYFKGYLEQRPSIWSAYVAGRDAAFAAKSANSRLAAAYSEATEGRTGIAAFDHWARELVRTGYLHNHARMWFASIWIFTLKLDWQLGADFFLRHLVDGDAASNTLSWRWVGGLHTKGKTYLARPDNIARYTANHPDGPLTADGIASEAIALEETEEHNRQALDLPAAEIAASLADKPYALILHDDGAHHVPLNLPHPPALVIGASRPEARSPGDVGLRAKSFANDAVANGVSDAAAAFDCDARLWGTSEKLSGLLRQAGIETIALANIPAGWTRDALMPDLQPLIGGNHAIMILPELDRATWPLAKAGFFGVRKQAQAILAELSSAEQR